MSKTKVNGIYVYIQNAITKESNLIRLFRELGFSKKIYFFNCFDNSKNNKKCDCLDYIAKKYPLHIKFTNSPFIKLTKKDLICIILSKKYAYKLLSYYDSYGFILNSKISKSIYINVGKIIGDGESLKNVLKHEILHIKNENHCKNKDCFFSNEDNSNPVNSFCKKCEDDFKEIIKDFKKCNGCKKKKECLPYLYELDFLKNIDTKNGKV